MIFFILIFMTSEICALNNLYFSKIQEQFIRFLARPLSSSSVKLTSLNLAKHLQIETDKTHYSKIE